MAGDEKQPTSSTSRRFRGLIVLFVGAMLFLHVLLTFSVRQRIAQGYPDFTVFYTAAKILRSGLGHQLYSARVQYQVQKEFAGPLASRHGPLPYIHPPFEALIFIPLTGFSYGHAFLIWNLLNVAMLLAVGLLLRPCVSTLQLIPPWQFVLLALVFFPSFACLLQGEDSILQLLLCTLAWRALTKKEDVLAGSWLALATFKFQLMFPLVLLLVIWKRRRVLIGFFAISLVLALISLALVGWQGLPRYPALTLRIANEPSLGGVPPNLLPNLHGLVMGWPLDLKGTLGYAITILSSTAMFLFSSMKGRSSDWREPGLLFSLAIATSELVSWQTNIHDFSLLLLPLVLLADYYLRPQQQRGQSIRALLYPIVPLLISPVWLVLWLVIGNVNLIAIPVLWWIWKLAQELSPFVAAI